jgi:hypothetical protein
MSAARNGLQAVGAAFGIAERIKAAPAEEAEPLFREHISLILDLPRNPRNELCRLLAKKTGKEVIEYQNEILATRRKQVETGDGRPLITANGRLLDELSGEITEVLESHNRREPELFRHGGGLVAIRRDETGRPYIQRHDFITLKGHVARRMRFAYARGGDSTLGEPPRGVIEDILKCSDGQFPALVAITGTPPIHEDGSICDSPGFDNDTGLYFAPEPGFKFAAVPDAPTAEDAAKARQFIADELYADFRFEGDADRANAFGALVTACTRACFEIRLPMFAIDAPVAGSGKTLLASVIVAAATGQRPEMSGLPESEPETRKAITALLVSGAPAIVLDNVVRALNSPALAKLLTCDVWSDRILGRTENFTGPNTAVWFVTGNNLSFGREIARRAVRIRLDPRMARPEARCDFKRPDEELLRWTRGNRGAIVGAVLTMVKAWITAGRPSAEVPALGSFNAWAKTVGGVLAFAGVTGFLSNINQVHEEADEESAEWEAFLRAWAIKLGDQPLLVSQVAFAFAGPESVLLPEGLDEIPPNGSQNKRFGGVLRRKAGTRFGDRELRIERAGKHSHTGNMLWRVTGNLEGLWVGSRDPEQAAE